MTPEPLFAALAAAGSAIASKPPLFWADLGLSPIALDLGFMTIKWYSLAYLAGILLGYWHLLRMARAPGSPLAQRHAEDLFFWCTLGIILGGRLGYATFYAPELWTHPANLLKLWQGGMSFHGGLIGTVMGIGWVCWRNGLNFIRVCDYISPCVPFGLFFGRCANFVNGELWGRVAGPDVPWAMVFPGAGYEARHPSQLYEAALEGLLLGAVLLVMFWKTRARWRTGLITGVFTLGYGLSRVVLELFRQPDAQLTALAEQTGLSMGQWLSLPLLLTGVILIARALWQPPVGGAGRAVPATGEPGAA